MPNTDNLDGLTKCSECGVSMGNASKCPECGHEIGAPKPSNDGTPKPKIVEDPMGSKEHCDKCGSKDGCTAKGHGMDGCKMKDACGPKKAKVDGESNTVQRLDYWGEFDISAEETEALKETPEGFLIGKAAFMGVGVYRYMGKDGKVVAEFRPPEEVFSKGTLDSYKLKPLTNTHPPESVTPDNEGKYAVGSLGEEIETDALNAYASIVIRKREGIDAAKAGRLGLSGGYSCDVKDSGEVSYAVTDWEGKEIGRKVYKIPGNYQGTPYDAIQTSIRGNHVALVDVPRGGDALHLRFDGADVGVGIRVPGNQTTPQPKGENMVKIKLDGSQEFEVHESVKARLDSLESEVASAVAAKDAAVAKADASEAAVKQVKADADALAASIPAKVQEGVSARLALVAKADGFGVAVKHEDSDESIRAAVIAAAMPSVKLDGLDEVKLDAYFAAACEVLTSRKADAGIQGQKEQIAGKPSEKQDSATGWEWSR